MSVLNDATNIARGSTPASIVNLGTTPIWPSGDDAYIIKIKHNRIDNNNFLLNLGVADNTLDIHVDWGDGTSNDYKGFLDYTTRPQHSGYINGQEYIITVKGKFNKLIEAGTAFRSDIIEVISWGSRNIGVTDVSSGFEGCSHLVSIPTDYRGFFTNTLYADYFLQNTKIKELPSGIFDKAINLQSARSICYSITTLKTYQPDLFYANKKLINVRSAFMGNHSLISRTPIGPDGIELWQRTAANGYVDGIQGEYCFNGCTYMENYDSIPCIGIVCWR